jgi:hypothetical protein
MLYRVAIFAKRKPKWALVFTITVFLVRIAFIRTKNTVGARKRASPFAAFDGIQDAV